MERPSTHRAPGRGRREPGRPLIVAGDFNAVDDHGPMRALTHDGLESATDIVGAGWLPTYPANRRFPPLIPIDHVLVNKLLTASSDQHVQGGRHRPSRSARDRRRQPADSERAATDRNRACGTSSTCYAGTMLTSFGARTMTVRISPARQRLDH